MAVRPRVAAPGLLVTPSGLASACVAGVPGSGFRPSRVRRGVDRAT